MREPGLGLEGDLSSMLDVVCVILVSEERRQRERGREGRCPFLFFFSTSVITKRKAVEITETDVELGCTRGQQRPRQSIYGCLLYQPPVGRRYPHPH